MTSKIDSKTGLTPDELKVMKHIINAYHAFIKLTPDHQNEIKEFVDGVHCLQDILALRIVRRAFPDGWYTGMNYQKKETFECRDNFSDKEVEDG